MQLILHIGTEKTGTTTLQRWCAGHRTALHAQGIHYPVSLGNEGHRDLSVLAMDADKPDDGYRSRGILSPTDHTTFSDQLKRAFAQEYDSNSHVATWLVSSEHLHSRLTTPRMVQRVREFFAGRFASIRVVIHLRPQIDVARSRVSTFLRGGRRYRSAWLEPQAPSDPYYNYNELVRRWEQAFGADAVTLVSFKRERDLRSVLANWLKFDITESIAPQNEGLDWRSIAILDALLTHMPDCAESIFLHDWPTREGLEIGLEAAQRFQEVFDQSNDALVARRNELERTDLTPDWSMYQTPANAGKIDAVAPFGEQLSYLVRRMQNELLLERCSSYLDKFRLAVALADLEIGRAHLREAALSANRIQELGATQARLIELRRQIGELSAQIGT